MPRSWGGTYRSRDSVRLSVAVTRAMWIPFLASENRRWCSSIQVRPEAFGSHTCGAPPSTGTTHVSHGTVYAMREPSGENSGLIFGSASRVSSTGSPLGSSLTYTWPAPANVLELRTKASMRPSGESAGETAESVKSVSWTHWADDGGGAFSRR